VIEAGYGPGAGGPPPPSGNRGLKFTLILVAVIVAIGGVLAAGVIAWNAVGDTVGADPSPTPTARETEELPLDRDDPSDVALEGVLTLIDESELTMIQFQIEVEQAVSDEAVREAGSTAARELRRLDEELSDTEVTGAYAQAVRAVRDSYLEHLRAWTTYVEATAEDPEAFLDPSGEYWQDITDTADVFVAAMEDDLPANIPDDLARFADFILDRGFRENGDPDGTLV
jgi:hypothetical protein